MGTGSPTPPGRSARERRPLPSTLARTWPMPSTSTAYSPAGGIENGPSGSSTPPAIRARRYPARDGVGAPQQPLRLFQVPRRDRLADAAAGHACAIHLEGVDLDQLPAITRRHVAGPCRWSPAGRARTPTRRTSPSPAMCRPRPSRSRNSSAVCDRKASSKCWTTTTSAPASAIRATFSSGSQIRSGTRPVTTAWGCGSKVMAMGTASHASARACNARSTWT